MYRGYIGLLFPYSLQEPVSLTLAGTPRASSGPQRLNCQSSLESTTASMWGLRLAPHARVVQIQKSPWNCADLRCCYWIAQVAQSQPSAEVTVAEVKLGFFWFGAMRSRDMPQQNSAVRTCSSEGGGLITSEPTSPTCSEIHPEDPHMSGCALCDLSSCAYC